MSQQIGRSDVADQTDTLKRLILDGSKMQAIKIYRDARGVTLQEAKSHVESLENQLRIEEPQAFHLPRPSEQEIANEKVTTAAELEATLRNHRGGWTVYSFDPWAMGFVAILECDGNRFSLIKDRGFFEVKKESGEALPSGNVPHQENLTEKKTIMMIADRLADSCINDTSLS